MQREVLTKLDLYVRRHFKEIIDKLQKMVSKTQAIILLVNSHPF